MGLFPAVQDPLHELVEDVRAILLASLHNAAPTNNARNRLNAPTLAKIHRSVSQLLPGQPTVARRIHQHHRERRSWYVSCAHRGAAGLHGCSRPRAATQKKKDSGALGCFWCHGVRALLLCFARAPALLTRPPC